MVETWVTVHDQDLIAACEADGRFAELPDVGYLFVGPRPVENLPLGAGILVARDYEPNVEHLPHFYDLTGWHVLARHASADHLICVQYDMRPAIPDLAERAVEQLADVPVVAFTPAGYGPNWMLLVDGFEQAWRRGMAAVGADPDRWPPFETWPTTAGTAWRREAFVEFLAWFEPLFAAWAGELWAGHLAERSLHAWLCETGRKPGYLAGAIEHGRADIHGTAALMRGERDVYEARDRAFRNQSSNGP
jgi:hypothetical protein